MKRAILIMIAAGKGMIVVNYLRIMGEFFLSLGEQTYPGINLSVASKSDVICMCVE